MKRSYRRHRNPQQNEKKQQPFFKSNAVDKKRDDSFFQSKSEGIKINKAGDKDEKEADTVATKIINRSSSNEAVQPRKKGIIQRVTLSTPKEDEKLGTAEQRMEKDKLIQEMPEGKAEEKEEDAMRAKPEVQEKAENEEEEMVQSSRIQRNHEKEEEGLQTKAEMTNEEEDKENTAQTKMEIQKQEEQESEEMIQTKSEKENEHPNAQLTAVLKRSKGKGRPMSTPLRKELEAHFKCSFKNVRIHTDQNAIWMCKHLRAQAFTNGYDIYFNEGKFRPESGEGKHLLIHELTHVVQQMYRPQK